jgi:putative membrane protein
MLRDVSLVVHLLGVVLWVGGSATGAWTCAQLALTEGPARGEALGAVRRALLALTVPGLALAWLGGLTMLVSGWTELYARAGWMHGKLTLALALSAVHGVLLGRIRRAASGEREASQSFFAGLAMAIVLVAAAVVSLALLHPGT